MNLRKVSIVVGVFAITVATAWLIGVQAGSLVTQSRVKEHSEQRYLQTKRILEEMGTIAVGDTLPNYALEDIDGKIWQLSELVADKAIISFFKPDCGACEQQLDEFRSTGIDPSLLILISADNPLHLKALAESDSIKSVMLYDENRDVTTALGITISPFNLIIDRTLRIERIEAGAMMAEELSREFDK